MLNSYSIVGEVMESPASLPNGAYSKMRLRLDNAKSNRTEIVEVVGKSDTLSDQFRPGCVVAITGQIGGKVNDKGYANLSLWASSASIVVGNAGHRSEYEPIRPRQRPAQSPAPRHDDEDPPY